MLGTVKFYNSDKGYGFIFTEELKDDLFFSISDWRNPTIPEAGDDIEFDTKDSNRGLKAINIKLLKSQSCKKQELFIQNDDRINCPNCKKKIVPRSITYKGRVQKTTCPYCSNTIKVLFNPIILDMKLKLISLCGLGVVILFLYFMSKF